MMWARHRVSILRIFIVLSGIGLTPLPSLADPASWRSEWPRTEFAKHSVSFAEIKSGGPPKDGLPSIDNPHFASLVAGRASGWTSRLTNNEPVISLSINGVSRAYPLRILIWHEIVNDTVGARPVAVTYCPLCNTALVFRDVGNVSVQKMHEGRLVDIPHDIPFAFAFHAFRPNSPIHKRPDDARRSR